MSVALSEEVQHFITEHRNGVIATFGKSGAAQMTVVTHGLYRGAPAFTSAGGLVKVRNLARDPRCSYLVMSPNGRSYVTIEGHAEVYGPDVTDPEVLRLALRDIYRAAARKEHPDWDDYDRAMAEQQRRGIVVIAERVYHNLGRYS